MFVVLLYTVILLGGREARHGKGWRIDTPTYFAVHPYLFCGYPYLFCGSSLLILRLPLLTTFTYSRDSDIIHIER